MGFTFLSVQDGLPRRLHREPPHNRSGEAGSRYNPALVEKRIHFGPGAGIAREKLQDPNVARLMDCPF
jgi:hypothetical protein